MTGYIAEMRKLIGQRTLIQCAGSILCIDKDGRLLLGQRADNRYWSYSGGAVEIDEKVEDCARRELLEEMGIVAEEIEFFCVNSGPEAHYIYPNGDEVSNIEIMYICRRYHGEPQCKDGEMLQLRYFAPEEIDLKMISPPTAPVIAKYLDEVKNK